MRIRFLLLLLSPLFILLPLLAVPSFVDWNSYKGWITQEIEEKSGYPLEIKGDLQLSLLPRPQLRAHDIRLGKAPNLHLEALDLTLTLNFPRLLRGRIVFSSLELTQAQVFLTPNESAQGAPLLALLAKQTQGEDSQWGVERIVLKDSTLMYKKEGVDMAFSATDAQIAIDQLRTVFTLTGKGQWKTSPIHFSGHWKMLEDKKASIKLDITSPGTNPQPSFQLQLTGQVVTSQDQTPSFTGNALLNVSELTPTLRAFFPHLQYGRSDDALLNSPLEIRAELSLKDEVLHFLSKEAVLAKVQFSTEGQIDFSHRLRIRANVLFDFLHINKFFADESRRFQIKDSDLARTDDEDFPHIEFRLHARHLIVKGRLINDFKSDILITPKDVILLKAQAQLPGKTKFTLKRTAQESHKNTGTITLEGLNLRYLAAWAGVDSDAVSYRYLHRYQLQANYVLESGKLTLSNLLLEFDRNKLWATIILEWETQKFVLGAGLRIAELNIDAYRGLRISSQLPPKEGIVEPVVPLSQIFRAVRINTVIEKGTLYSQLFDNLNVQIDGKDNELHNWKVSADRLLGVAFSAQGDMTNARARIKFDQQDEGTILLAEHFGLPIDSVAFVRGNEFTLDFERKSREHIDLEAFSQDRKKQFTAQIYKKETPDIEDDSWHLSFHSFAILDEQASKLSDFLNFPLPDQTLSLRGKFTVKNPEIPGYFIEEFEMQIGAIEVKGNIHLSYPLGKNQRQINGQFMMHVPPVSYDQGLIQEISTPSVLEDSPLTAKFSFKNNATSWQLDDLEIVSSPIRIFGQMRWDKQNRKGHVDLHSDKTLDENALVYVAQLSAKNMIGDQLSKINEMQITFEGTELQWENIPLKNPQIMFSWDGEKINTFSFNGELYGGKISLKSTDDFPDNSHVVLNAEKINSAELFAVYDGPKIHGSLSLECDIYWQPDGESKYSLRQENLRAKGRMHGVLALDLTPQERIGLSTVRALLKAQERIQSTKDNRDRAAILDFILEENIKTHTEFSLDKGKLFLSHLELTGSEIQVLAQGASSLSDQELDIQAEIFFPTSNGIESSRGKGDEPILSAHIFGSWHQPEWKIEDSVEQKLNRVIEKLNP